MPISGKLHSGNARKAADTMDFQGSAPTEAAHQRFKKRMTI
jgi:hypothetical protein